MAANTDAIPFFGYSSHFHVRFGADREKRVKGSTPSPREFMKARRPEHFSDSTLEEEVLLDRSTLEYHLHTITSRNQEADFAAFARMLAEREICPNLLPQTGPTGGGDSKSDSETYPVAEELATAWFVGTTGSEAASENWAFAISATKRWKAKASSDIEKIAGKKRSYTKAFFITNQFVRDKERAKVEDDLRKKHGLDVRILDRTWILDRIFSGKHEQLAASELKISAPARSLTHRGPRDVQRERDLQELEARIVNAVREQRLSPVLVDDCLDAAILARDLERPRTQVDGLFDRASRLAKECGGNSQQFSCAYMRAWTAFWFFEDVHAFLTGYSEAERLGHGSENAHDLERLTNLWSLLRGAVARGTLTEQEASLDSHSALLKTALERLAGEETRPTAALQARTHLHTIALTEAIQVSDGAKVEAAFKKLSSILRQAEKLVGYPFKAIAEIVIESGDTFGSIPGYNELFEQIVAMVSRRTGEVSAARLLLKRGAQELNADHPYEAIRLLGRAICGLQKHESRRDAARALRLISEAYEDTGLLWAARGAALHTAALGANALSVYSEVEVFFATACDRLRWVELQLGRLAQSLAWHKVLGVLQSILEQKHGALDGLAKEHHMFDGAFAIQILRVDLWLLDRLASIPDSLDAWGLPFSAAALLFALGHENRAASLLGMEESDPSTVQALLLKAEDQPAASELRVPPTLGDEAYVTLFSKVLGSELLVEVQNNATALEVAESLLAALEAFLSTTVGASAPLEPRISCRITKTELGSTKPIEFTVDRRDGRPHFDVRCSSIDAGMLTAQMQVDLKEALFDLVVQVTGGGFTMREPEATLKRLLADEAAADRAINFAAAFAVQRSILGDSPPTSLAEWATLGSSRYAMQRRQDWRPARQSKSESTPVVGKGRTEGAVALPPPGRPDSLAVKHSDMEVVSPIRHALWHQAEWRGTAFAVVPGRPVDPILALLFKDRGAAIEIFRLWRKEFGDTDPSERLRIAIVRGIQRANPCAYRVIVGMNPLPAKDSDTSKQFIMMTRSNTMGPSSGVNLERFLASYAARRAYQLAPAVILDERSKPDFLIEYALQLRTLHVRDGWQVGLHDPDIAGLAPSDDPIIPDGDAEVPVREALAWLRTRR